MAAICLGFVPPPPATGVVYNLCATPVPVCGRHDRRNAMIEHQRYPPFLLICQDSIEHGFQARLNRQILPSQKAHIRTISTPERSPFCCNTYLVIMYGSFFKAPLASSATLYLFLYKSFNGDCSIRRF